VSGRLLKAYPAAWRERYGAELVSLIEAGAEGGRVSVRVQLDVIASGLAQRLRSSGLVGDDAPPERRIRAGVLVVLSAWAAFVVAGLGLAKTAEHWQAVTPRPDRGVPAAAYDGVLLGAALGTLAVLLGIMLTVPPLVAFLRTGGWMKIHRAVLRALGATGFTALVLVGVIFWAHRLTVEQRNGGDVLYAAVFIVLCLCAIGSIALWTRAAVVTAGELALNSASLRWETLLAAATTVTMVGMTLSSTVWWAAVAGSSTLRMLGLTLLMVAATLLATAGTFRSVQALRS
jgi:hypothetical protein